MKYQAGDLVVIKPRKLIEEQGNMLGRADTVCHALEGTDRVVSFLCYGELGEGTCWIRTKDGKEFIILEPIILGHAFEYGDEIEVSDDGKSWVKAKFWQHKIGYIDVYETDGRCYQFARPIRKPKLEAVPENIRFRPFDDVLALDLNNNKSLVWHSHYKDWLVLGRVVNDVIPTYLQPCKAKDLKVGDWFIVNPEYKVNLNRYNLVTAINDRNISVCYTENGGIRLAGYSLLETYYKVVRGEE